MVCPPIAGMAYSHSSASCTNIADRQTGALVYTLGAGAALTPILGCRLVLNLRDAYYKPFATEFEQNDVDLHIATESLDSQSPQHPFAIELDNPKRCAELRDRS